ncbi:hypothetical protein KPH14_012501 [Odynerus spinipes]|uniref:Uncharacterized protein n=1 Tax=Odynerus spinipes TaxID=1348599 RepID=A0AAD9VNI3_9HYME|nr:hypothetical protein KPH14_012501 [Odynerus spinipes]
MSLLSRRSKSTSNVIETPAFKTKDVRNSIERRCKTCSSDNLYTDKKTEATTSLSAEKSQKFFTKLVASLEKKNNKNGDFNAADEFLTKCYTKPLIPRINSHYPNYGASTTCVYNQRGSPLNNKKEAFEPEMKTVNTSKKEFESSAVRPIHDVDQSWRATMEESSDAVIEKKVNRKRSIKGILRSIMGWKKHTGKSGRFQSCDELEVREKFSSMNLPMIPRARSLQTFGSNNTKDKNIIESLDRNATIRPFYGGRRNHTTPQKLWESHHLKKIPFREDSGYGSGFFSVEESNENLVKPSAVREIARRLSYHPEQPWNRKNDTGPIQVLNYHKKEESSYRRISFTKTISDVGGNRSFDLANSSICTLPVTRKLKDEYLSVLAKNKRLSAEYENTHIALYRSQRDRP